MGAALIDGLLVAGVAALIAVTLGVDGIWSDSSDGDSLLWAASSGLASFAYFPVLMRATDGRTLGKMATRIRVVRTDERPMSFARAAWREVLVKTGLVSVPWIGWLLGLVDDLWPLWDPQNRAIHDMAAGTRVVRSDIPRRRDAN